MNTALDVPPPGTFDDVSIARRVAQGDITAFERLMRQYNRRLYRLARAALSDDAEAQDALQDAYLCAYSCIGQFRGEAALSTWLSRLVLNECSGKEARRPCLRPTTPSTSNRKDRFITPIFIACPVAMRLLDFFSTHRRMSLVRK